MSNPTSQHPYRLLTFTEKITLPFLHPQPSTPRSSRDWADTSRRTSIGLPTPTGTSSHNYGFSSPRRKGVVHRPQLSLSMSSFSPRGVVLVLILLAGLVWSLWKTWGQGLWWKGENWDGNGGSESEGLIPLGQSRVRDGREVFWWEERFVTLEGYFGGIRELVDGNEWISEQELKRERSQGRGSVSETESEAIEAMVRIKEPELVDVTPDKGFTPCYIDEENDVLPPKLFAYHGLPYGFPAPLFGSQHEVGLRCDVCYDRTNRFGPYGSEFSEDDVAGLGIRLERDIKGKHTIQRSDYHDVRWGEAQEKCTASKKYSGPRTAFVIRTWDEFEYTPHHIALLRSIISELALASGGRYTVHFLIHVQNDSIPIWASKEVYDEVLNASLPVEFAGMGTLWSVAQMKLIYPPPFPDSIVNFSGDGIYKAYRSLHFPLQYFAEMHPEFEFFWEWEMDIRVTGGYLELLEEITHWAEQQDKEGSWEKSAKFYIPELYGADYAAYEQSVRNGAISNGKTPISGPQLPSSERLSIPGVTDTPYDNSYVDLITLSPLFDPQRTRWAFHDDITGYSPESRPPTRAALVTASRLSRRLLLTMHHETFEKKHTMFPEMFPASIALHYGYKAVYAPLPIYFDRDWPAHHADEIFNNVVIGEEAREAGMDHGAGHFHGERGSVFGPGEHVFRGATWYSNARFAGYLWRRWLGEEKSGGEIEWEKLKGRMCLPMMVLHPVKFEVYK